MSSGRIEVSGQYRGTDLRAIGRDLESMTDARVGRLFKRHLEDAAKPYPAKVRRSALSIPSKKEGSTGLRYRIARCVTLSSGIQGREAWVSVWIDPRKMDPDYKTLPLYMQGAGGVRGRNYTRWRHPVFGTWRPNMPNQPSHPYFYQSVEGLSRAAEGAIEAALEDVSRELHG